MAGHRNISQLREKMGAERRQANGKAAYEATRELLLTEIRRALGLTQEKTAEAMGVSQSALSRLEGQSDMHVSTLRRMVEAMGGELEIVAKLPNERISVSLGRQPG